MNLYETVYVVRQDIRPEDLKPIEEKFENLLRNSLILGLFFDFFSSDTKD